MTEHKNMLNHRNEHVYTRNLMVIISRQHEIHKQSDRISLVQDNGYRL